MLATLLIWSYTLAAAGLIGWACCRLISRAAGTSGGQPLSFTLYWLVGCAALAGLAALLSLAIPLSLAAQVIVLVLALVALLAWRKNLAAVSMRRIFQALGAQPAVTLLVTIGALSLLVLATSRPSNDDTGLYHAQAIRWMETYPAVPGLANIHTRLGYGSSWLTLQALFSFAFLGVRSFHLDTSVLFLAAIVYFAGGLGKLWKGRGRLSDWVRTLFFPLVFYILTSEVSSPGTDAPVVLITWIVLAEWLAYAEDGASHADPRPLLLTLISIYAITIKLSAFPLALPGLIVLGRSLFHRKWRAPLIGTGLALLVLLPWMAHNVVQTGYAVYPFPALDLFTVDWKVPPSMVRTEAAGIEAWARLPRQDAGRVLSLTLRQWVPEWFANLTANRRAILLAALLGPLAYLLLGIWKRFRLFLLGMLKTAWPVYLAAYLGLAFWFFTAPDYRFGAGYIIAALALVLAPPVLFVQENWPSSSRALPWLAAGALIGFQVWSLGSSIDLKTLPGRLVLPADYPLLPTYPCQVEQTTFMIPEDVSYGLCYYGVFPCIPSCRNDFEQRGALLQDGFRHKNPSQ